MVKEFDSLKQRKAPKSSSIYSQVIIHFILHFILNFNMFILENHCVQVDEIEHGNGKKLYCQTKKNEFDEKDATPLMDTVERDAPTLPRAASRSDVMASP